MPGELKFRFDDLIVEINAMRTMAADFLDPAASAVLTMLENSLSQIRSRGHGRSSSWGIPDHSPLRTGVSKGGYEPDGRGKHKVYAEMTSIWDITPADARPQGRKLSKNFKVVGKASTRIRIKQIADDGGEQELAMWRAELADNVSPGCYFHIQVRGEGDPPFPHSMSVPRFPAIAFTPMAALEFVLGELFQDQWSREAAKEGGARDQWKGIQRKRLMAVLKWKHDRVSTCTGSPWAALKRARPEPTLFI